MIRILLALLVTQSVLRADDKVWSAVVLASKAPRGAESRVVPPELTPYAKKLSKVFGYDQFEILGSATKVLEERSERWLVPTQNFWLGIKSQRRGSNFQLELEFYHDKRRLVETTALLGPRTPLVIRGPLHARGQILVIFEVRP